MIFMYSQKTLFFIEDIIFVTVKSLNVGRAGPRICGLHPPIIDTAFIKASFSQMIKLGLVPHPALTRKPGYPPFLLHRTQGEVHI